MIGILSDAHGNGEVFQKMVEVLFARGATRLIFLGDAVGYIPDISVLDQLMALGDKVRCIRGNHEEMLLTGDYPEKLEPLYRIKDARLTMTREHETFIGGWPRSMLEEYPCGTALFVHGSPHDLQNGYVYPDTDLEVFDVPYDFVFMGHTHRAFKRMHKDTMFVNTGSCGLPRDDGRYASAALMDPVQGGVRIIRLELSSFHVEQMLVFHDAHASVRGLFTRRQEHVEGEIIEAR
jgi:putative phosphoesterase